MKKFSEIITKIVKPKNDEYLTEVNGDVGIKNFEEIQNNEKANDSIDKNVKLLKIEDIVIDPDFSKTFSINNEVLEKIRKSIRENGYDIPQPVVVWDKKKGEGEGKDKGNYILVDGYSRRKACIEEGLLEIWSHVMHFHDHNDAYVYNFKRQLERRNLSPKEILKAIELQPKKTSRDGSGRADEQLAKEIGISTSSVSNAKFVVKFANELEKEAIEKDEKSVNQVYQDIKKRQKINKNKDIPPEEKQVKKSSNEKKNKLTSSINNIKENFNIEDILKILFDNNEKNALRIIIENFKCNISNELVNKYFNIES